MINPETLFISLSIFCWRLSLMSCLIFASRFARSDWATALIWRLEPPLNGWFDLEVILVEGISVKFSWVSLGILYSAPIDWAVITVLVWPKVITPFSKSEVLAGTWTVLSSVYLWSEESERTEPLGISTTLSNLLKTVISPLAFSPINLVPVVSMEAVDSSSNTFCFTGIILSRKFAMPLLVFAHFSGDFVRFGKNSVD